MNKTKITVIGGYGYVGRSVHELFSSHEAFTSTIRDKGKTAFDGADADLAIVCVPTPMTEFGTCNTSIVENVIANTDFPLYLIKSAVPPGTTERLAKAYKKRICVSPEYIGEGNYTMPWWEGKPHPTDMSKHNFQIFGGDQKDTEILVKYFSKIMGPYCKYFQTDSRTAELVKYMENSFFATKVTFCHEFSRIAKALGVNYAELREFMPS
jgi:UDP-glucose 6-dehydrogenase